MAIDYDLTHSTPFCQGELLAMPPITAIIKEFVPQGLIDKELSQLLVTRWGCPHLSGFLLDLVVKLCVCILHMPSSMLITILPHYFTLGEHYGVVKSNHHGIAVHGDSLGIADRNQVRCHKDVIHSVEVQAVVLLAFPLSCNYSDGALGKSSSNSA